MLSSAFFSYLQGTPDLGLFLGLYISSSITIAYSNVDWDGCKDSCCSTMGYVVYFGPNLIAGYVVSKAT